MGAVNLINVLCKALSFLAIIILGYCLKKRGIFKDGFREAVTFIALNLTLPAAILSSFVSFQKDNSLFALMLMGLLVNFFMLFVGFIFSAGKERNVKVLYMLNCPGYNIGSFCMPFIQGFLGAQGVVATCMFDTGNALMTCGGSYAVASACLGSGSGKFSFGDFIKKMFCSVPFDTYIIAILLAVFNIKVPEALGNFISTTASANGFMAMLMLGLSLDFNIDKKYYGEISRMLFIKYLISAALAGLIYFVLPFDTMIKHVLTIVVFSPTSALVPAFTEKLGANTEASAFAGSVSIVISIIIMVALVTIVNP